MKFRNQRHREMFTKAIHQLDRGNYTLMAVVYLFAADTRLWSMTEKSIYYSGVDFSRIRLRNCSEGLYTLVLCSQRPVLRYRQTYHRQPCDAEVVPPKVINVVCIAPRLM